LHQAAAAGNLANMPTAIGMGKGMADPERDRPRVKVPVGAVAAEAYRAVFGRLGLLLELGWLPLLALLAAALLPGLLDGRIAPAALPSANDWLPELVDGIVAVLALNAFAVRWHRAMLFPPAHTIPRRVFLRAWARFLLYTLILYLAAAGLVAGVLVSGTSSGALAGTRLPADAATGVVTAVAVALGVALWLATARCALLFPAAAAERPFGWAEAWRLMRGNTWRLIGCSLLVGVPFATALVLLLSGVLTAAHVDPDVPLADQAALGLFLLGGVVDTLAKFFAVALGASVLSGFYRRILRGHGL
jgi:hypothetical protein